MKVEMLLSPDRRRSTRRKESEQPLLDMRRNDRRHNHDRRSQVRLAFESWIKEVTSDNFIYRRTANVSLGGIFLDQAVPYPLGSTLTLMLELPSDERPV